MALSLRPRSSSDGGRFLASPRIMGTNRLHSNGLRRIPTGDKFSEMTPFLSKLNLRGYIGQKVWLLFLLLIGLR